MNPEQSQQPHHALANRLPPGQQLVAAGKWPIIGEKSPAAGCELDRIMLHGCGIRQRQWSLRELQQLPQTTRTLDIHCVTRWSMLDVVVGGVLLEDLWRAEPPPLAARYISFISYSERRHSTSLTLSDAVALPVIIATTINGAPIPPEHGGPIRNIVAGKYFYKSVKWLAEIELLSADRLGYWEAESGYHNGADPWREERYMAPDLDKRRAAQLIESRNFSGQDLRSIQAQGRDLTGLVASDAKLRDADFRDCQLQRADFCRANLSNAHFSGADLQQAKFREADVEGANFAGADLRGADFSGASLFGSTFVESSPATTRAARLDSSTIIPRSQWSALTPLQLSFLERSLGTEE